MDMNNKKALITKTITFAASCLMTSMAAASVESTTTYTYNSLGLVATIDGPRTDVTDITTFGYDTQGNRTSITNALSHLTQITAHDANGRPLTVVDPNGVTTQLTYDARGRLLTRTTAGQTTTMTYDNVGNITRITQPDDSYINYEYDAAHRLIAISDILGNRIQYTLDNAGNRTKEEVYDPSSTLKRTHSNTFDELSRMIKDIGAANQTASFSYDPNGNQTGTTDPNQNSTTQAFDALNRLTQITDAASGNTIYGYDAQDNLTSVTDPRGNTTSYTYDALGNLITQQSPDTGTSTFTYDNAGNRISSTDARNITANYSYDSLNRITSIQYPTDSTQNITYSYDQDQNGIGRLTGITDASGSTSYSYDNQGNITTKSVTQDSVSFNTTYSYDNTGRLSNTVYPSGWTISYQRNSAGQITEVTAAKDGTSHTLINSINYAPFGQAVSWNSGNGLSTNRDLDLDYQLAQQLVGGIFERTYSYDPNGNITGIVNLQDSTQDQTISYDELNRLTTAQGGYEDLTYLYDAIGNRTQETEGSAQKSYIYANDSSRLTQIDTTKYQYNATGNLTNDGEHNYQYSVRNRLTTINNGDTASYSYNALGQRVKKQVGNSIDYAALAEEFAQKAQVHRDHAAIYQTQAEQKRTEAQAATQQAADYTQQATQLEGEAQTYILQAEQYTTEAQELQQQSDQKSQSAQEMRDRIVENPSWWQRFMNIIYQWIADSRQQQADDLAQQAQQQQQLADQATQQAQALTQQAEQLHTQAEQQTQLAQSLNQEADQLQGQADQETQLAQEDQQQSDEYAALADEPQNAPQQTIYFAYNEVGQLIGEYDEAGAAKQEIVYLDGTPIALLQNEQVYYIHTDHLGTPRAMTDTNGTLVWSWEAKPFGDSAPNEDPDGDSNNITLNLRFPGQYYDQETGLYYNYYRYYDPSTGRYITSDPIGLEGGLNTYAYVGGNPLYYYDPYGLFGWADMPTLPSWSVNGIAGFGNTLSFGLTGMINNALGSSVNKCSDAYRYGGYTALVAQLVGTGGSLALRAAAKGMSQQAARAGQTAYMRRLYPTGSNHSVHHLNPLKGHPSNIWPGFQRLFGNSAVFPTAALPGMLKHGRFNVSKVSNATHTFLHKRLMVAEGFAKILFNPVTLPVRGAQSYTNGCECQ